MPKPLKYMLVALLPVLMVAVVSLAQFSVEFYIQAVRTTAFECIQIGWLILCSIGYFIIQE